jgi:hypothetical protein
MALPAPKGREGWVALAQIRILRVLAVRIAATIRQLEVKISESGPPTRRAQPHILETAIGRMLDTGQLVAMRPERLARDERETLFYTLPEFHPNPAMERMNRLLVHYRAHRMLARTQDYCGDVLEKVIDATFAAAGAQYQYIGHGIPGEDIGSLDGVWQLNGQLIGVEAKNVREWVYPRSERVWRMIRKCLVVDAVPLLVTREAAYVTHMLFSRMGLMAFEIHRQLFSPLVPAYYLTGIRHTDELGYKDVLTWNPAQPHPHLLRFLRTTFPRELPGVAARWATNKALLTEFAINRRLGARLDDGVRERLYREFSQIVFPPPEPPALEPDEYEDEFGGFNEG